MNLKTVTFGSFWTSLSFEDLRYVCVPLRGSVACQARLAIVSVYMRKKVIKCLLCVCGSVSISLWQWPLAGLPCADLAGIRALPAKDGPELCVWHSELAFAGSARHTSHSQGQVLHVASPRASGTNCRVKGKHTDRGYWALMGDYVAFFPVMGEWWKIMRWLERRLGYVYFISNCVLFEGFEYEFKVSLVNCIFFCERITVNYNCNYNLNFLFT